MRHDLVIAEALAGQERSNLQRRRAGGLERGPGSLPERRKNRMLGDNL
jgi:hypothetical protein